MSVKIPQEWKEWLSEYTETATFKSLIEKVDTAYSNKVVYPPKEEIFNAFNHFKPEDLKVVILGQDPYHQQGQANGLAFSVTKSTKIPPSLRNIYTELMNDQGIMPSPYGDLTNWAKQGVLLLNTYLTVEDSKPMAHSKWGWEDFTDFVIKKTNQNLENIVFILWGNFANKKATFIDTEKHLIIHSAHPSPLSASRGFLGSKPFSLCNQYLAAHNKQPIDWAL